jgi:hypothetical protein
MGALSRRLYCNRQCCRHGVWRTTTESVRYDLRFALFVLCCAPETSSVRHNTLGDACKLAIALATSISYYAMIHRHCTMTCIDARCLCPLL